MENPIISPAQSLLKNQKVISDHKPEIEQLIQAVGRAGDLYPFQWIQLISFIYEFRPDFILELGRGYGNSTCAFNEVCHLMKPDRCEVLSLCISNDWDQHTAPNLRRVVSSNWFDSLTTLNANILSFDFEKVLQDKKRVVLFWDAHGFDIAEVVLGRILPLIKDKATLVIMHDITDTRYVGSYAQEYGDSCLWKGKNDWSGPKVQIGHIQSSVEQAIAAIDFCSRNKISLHSSDKSYHTEISDPDWDQLVNVLGKDYTSKCGHWYWFTLMEAPGNLTFPKMSPHDKLLDRIDIKKKSGIFSSNDTSVKNNSNCHVTDALNPTAVAKITFNTIFNVSEKNMIQNLESNFYSKGEKNDEIRRINNGIQVYPTTPRDHLATRFFPLLNQKKNDKYLLKIGLAFPSKMLDNVTCDILLQDQNYTDISGNLLPHDLSQLQNSRELIQYRELDADIQQIRLVINFNNGMPSVLPNQIGIEQAVFQKRFGAFLSFFK